MGYPDGGSGKELCGVVVGYSGGGVKRREVKKVLKDGKGWKQGLHCAEANE